MANGENGDCRKWWLPKMATGELVAAIGMTEPGTGSDLQRIRTRADKNGNGYKINGQKTFITNGQTADLILLACKTDVSQGAKGVSLIMVETDGAEGFRRGRKTTLALNHIQHLQSFKTKNCSHCSRLAIHLVQFI